MITTILVIIGLVGFVADGTLDVYGVWIGAALLTGWWLIEDK